MLRQQTPSIVYLVPSGSSSSGVIDNDDAFFNMKFYPAHSLLEMEAFSGAKTTLSVSSVNGHSVELDVNSTPVSSLQALDDWDSIQ